MAVYPTYLSLASVDDYLEASPRSTAYSALTDDEKSKYIVEATRMFNRQAWAGTPTEDYPADQDLAWPRDGIDGVTDGTTPQAILDGFCELVNYLVSDSAFVNASSSGKNIQRVDAGKGVGVTFFSPTTATAGRFPVAVQELVGEFLATAVAGGTAISVATGTDHSSSFDDCDDFDLSGA